MLELFWRSSTGAAMTTRPPYDGPAFYVLVPHDLTTGEPMALAEVRGAPSAGVVPALMRRYGQHG